MALDRAELERELRRLRRDEGRTLVKLQACPNLREALGSPSDDRLIADFDAAIAGLGNSRHALALKNAYAIGLSLPRSLTERRIDFAAQDAVDRSPDTVRAWEDEQLDEFVARLIAGSATPTINHLMVAVAIEAGRIVAVTEGESESGKPMRQWFNPVTEPFWPGFIYVLPEFYAPKRLTISGFFVDATPHSVYAEATGDLLAFTCGDQRRQLKVVRGGIPGLDAAAYVAVHWDRPDHGVYFGLMWQLVDPTTDKARQAMPIGRKRRSSSRSPST